MLHPTRRNTGIARIPSQLMSADMTAITETLILSMTFRPLFLFYILVAPVQLSVFPFLYQQERIRLIRSNGKALNSNLGNCFIISPEYSDTVPSGTTNYYEPILTASIPDGYKLFGITGLRASSASIYFYSSGRRLTYNQIQIGLKSVDTSDLSGVVYLYRFIFIKENMISIH